VKPDPSNVAAFEAIATAHLGAAYNLARWLTRDAVLAQDVVQDAMLRALTYFHSFRGENPRAWLLQIVRNVALNNLATRRKTPESIDASESVESSVEEVVEPGDDPEVALQRQQDQARAALLLNALPTELRECLVLREIEECSYKEIARITDAPIGTVMSRLWRARQMLVQAAAKSGESK
jgi:RNA polymerase sigma-70 factor (ECF subfamily)